MNGKANVVNPASFVSCDVLIVDVANEYTFPFEPTPTNPDDSEGRDRVPIEARVVDELTNDEYAVDDE